MGKATADIVVLYGNMYLYMYLYIHTYIPAAPVGEAVGNTVGVVGEEQQRGGGGGGGGGFWRWRSPALGALLPRNEISPKLDGGGELVGGDVKVEVETFAQAREERANWPSEVEMLKRLVQAHILKRPLKSEFRWGTY
jgi:hypothetical protein